MSDVVGIVGDIGTWLAVLFAILALVGVVSPILIYLSIRGQRGIALNAVDDRTHSYVGRGIRAWDEKRAFRRVKVPNLKYSPHIEYLEVTQIVKDGRKRAYPSTTGWIMFSNVLHDYGFNVKYKNGLAFENSESFLPVHMDWVLIIGLLGRYGRREDHGIPIGGHDNIPAVFLRASSQKYIHLSGNTGAMLISRTPSETNKSLIYFQSHFLVPPRFNNDVPFKLLLALYLGCFLTHDGAFCKFSVRAIFSSRRYPDFMKTSFDVYQLHSLSENDWDSAELTLLRRLGVKDVRLLQFMPTKYGAGDLEESRIHHSGPIRFLKTDLHRVYFWALTMPWSPHSFLFGDDDPRGHARFLARMFNCEGNLATALSAAAEVLKKHQGGQKLSRLIELINNAEPGIDGIAKKIPFSRSISKYWHGLDKALRDFCGDKSTFMLTISILCVDNRDFTSRIIRRWRAYSGQDELSHERQLKPFEELPSIVIDIAANEVIFPYEEFADGSTAAETSYYFDFKAIFPKLVESKYQQFRLSYTMCVIAYAQAKLREVMFRMLLQASDLKSALGIPYDRFYFADSTRGIHIMSSESTSS